MAKNIHSLRVLIESIITYFESHHNEGPGVDLILRKLARMDFFQSEACDVSGQSIRHNKILDEAVAGIVTPSLSNIAVCLAACKADLFWCEDGSQFYLPGADLGEGYNKCNLHTVLVGPKSSGFYAQDFMLGMFMLGPWTFYRDHRHDAPELYLNLSENSGWRFNFGEWHDCSAGSLVWNEKGKIHATRVYDKPFIAVFAWLANVNSKCQVVFSEDWSQIEQDLASRNKGRC
jgi:hypothetical protein